MDIKSLAIVMANDPRMGALLYDEMEKQRKRETLKRISSLVDLNEPNFKALRAMLQADLINPDQYFNAALALKQYQNTVYQFIYKMNKDIFDMQSQLYKNQLDKIRTESYVKTQEAIQRNQDIDAKTKMLNYGRQTVELYLKPYEEAINVQYDNLIRQISTEVSLSKGDFFQRFREAPKENKLKMIQDLLNETGLTKEYYPKLNALAHAESLLKRAKIKAYEMMDRLVQQKGTDAFYNAGEVVAKGLTQALHNQHAINYYMNLNFQDPNSRDAINKTEREIRNMVVEIFGEDLGKAVLAAMEADKKVFGDSVVAPTPVILEEGHEMDEDEEDKSHFGLMGIGAAASAVAIHHGRKWYKKWKENRGVTQFDKEVIKEAQKAAGVPNEMVKEAGEEVSEKAGKKIESSLFKSVGREASKKEVRSALGRVVKRVGPKVAKGAATAGALVGFLDEFFNPEELNAEETKNLKSMLNQGRTK